MVVVSVSPSTSTSPRATATDFRVSASRTARTLSLPSSISSRTTKNAVLAFSLCSFNRASFCRLSDDAASPSSSSSASIRAFSCQATLSGRVRKRRTRGARRIATHKSSAPYRCPALVGDVSTIFPCSFALGITQQYGNVPPQPTSASAPPALPGRYLCPPQSHRGPQRTQSWRFRCARSIEPAFVVSLTTPPPHPPPPPPRSGLFPVKPR